MTLPNERKYAVVAAKEFLLDLFLGKHKRVPKEVRAIARNLLKYYPADYQLDKIAQCKKCRKIIGNNWDDEYKED